ncbi:MAG: hypothetical protein KME30_26855 [Iphinoe sp. HA4291-MV1]|nr:hypothetical protein [Iphinoe sp. HA4291-MV1]
MSQCGGVSKGVSDVGASAALLGGFPSPKGDSTLNRRRLLKGFAQATATGVGVASVGGDTRKGKKAKSKR